MRRLMTLGWAVGLCVLIAAAQAPAQAPAVVSQVPADAPLFIAVPNVSALSRKLAMLDQKLGLNQPELGDALAFVKTMNNMEKGVDDNGSFALVLLALPQPDAQEPPPSVMLVPVTDYKAFASNFEGAKADGLTPIQLMGQPMFLKPAGKYAAIGKSQDVVTAFKLAEGDNGFIKRAGALGGKSLTSADYIIYVDLAKVGPTALPMVEQGLEQARMQLENNAVPNAGLARAMIDAYGQFFRAVFTDGDAAVIGATLTEQGVGVSTNAQFKAGSALANTFANAPAKELTIDRLPGRPFMFAATVDFSTLPLKKWVSDLAARLPANDPMTGLISQGAKLFDTMGESFQQAMYPPNLAGGAPALFTAVAVYPSAKPAAFTNAYQSMIQDLGKLQAQGVSYKTTYQDNVKQVAGKPVDSFTTQINMPPEQMAELGPLGGLLLQQTNGNLVELDNAVVVTTGADDALLTDAINAAGGKGTLVQTPGFADVRATLPAKRVMETYVGVGTIMQMAGSFLMMFAPQMAINVPADLPPVAVSSSVDAGGINVHYQVPMPVIVAVKNVVNSLRPPGGEISPPNRKGNKAPRSGPGAPPSSAAPASPMSKNVLSVGEAEFDAQVLGADKPVLVEFFADYISACKAQSATTSAVADELAGQVKVVRVDANSKVGEKYQVQAVPTLMVFKNGKVTRTFAGLTEKQPLVAALR